MKIRQFWRIFVIIISFRLYWGQIKSFNFSKFTSGVTASTDKEDSSKSKFDIKNINFHANPNNPNDMDPIQVNTSDLTYKFENDDPITKYNSNMPNINGNSSSNNNNNNDNK